MNDREEWRERVRDIRATSTTWWWWWWFSVNEIVLSLHMKSVINGHYVLSPDGDTDYFDIVAGVPQGDTLAPYLFIICLDYVLRTSIDKIKENGFKLTKERSRRYPAHTITDADYVDDIALLANSPAQAKFLLHSLERAAGGIALPVNADKNRIHVL